VVIFHVLKYSLHGAGNVCAAVDLACTQAKLGHKVYVCSSVGSFDALLAEHGVESIRINQMGGAHVLVAAIARLHRTLREIKPDIVHAHMMMSALLAAALRPLLRFQLVTSVHNDFQRSAILMAVGQRVIGVSEAVSRSMIRRGVPASRMRTVLNGTIDSPRRPPPAPAPLALQRPAIVTVCGMHPRKGVPDLIAAYALVAAQCPDAHLYLIGSGPMQADYEALARATSQTGITFVGHLDDPRPYLLGADIFVLASHAEPAGLALCEAREAGCAIVATDVGGIPEMLDGGAAGILVPPRRPDRLAEAILGLARNPACLAEMRARARANLERFTMDRVARETEQVYRELVVRMPRLRRGVAFATLGRKRS
jgi:glycosyltransferase involved in cell wall biosynthesis